MDKSSGKWAKRKKHQKPPGHWMRKRSEVQMQKGKSRKKRKLPFGKRNAFRLHRQRTPKRPCQRTRSPDWSLRIKDIQSIKRRMYSAAQKVFLKNLSFLFSHFVISLRIYKTLQKKRKPGWRMKKIRRRLSFSGSRRAVFCAMYVPEEGRDP